MLQNYAFYLRNLMKIKEYEFWKVGGYRKGEENEYYKAESCLMNRRNPGLKAGAEDVGSLFPDILF